MDITGNVSRSYLWYRMYRLLLILWRYMYLRLEIHHFVVRFKAAG